MPPPNSSQYCASSILKAPFLGAAVIGLGLLLYAPSLLSAQAPTPTPPPFPTDCQDCFDERQDEPYCPHPCPLWTSAGGGLEVTSVSPESRSVAVDEACDGESWAGYLAATQLGISISVSDDRDNPDTAIYDRWSKNPETHLCEYEILPAAPAPDAPIDSAWSGEVDKSVAGDYRLDVVFSERSNLENQCVYVLDPDLEDGFDVKVQRKVDSPTKRLIPRPPKCGVSVSYLESNGKYRWDGKIDAIHGFEQVHDPHFGECSLPIALTWTTTLSSSYSWSESESVEANFRDTVKYGASETLGFSVGREETLQISVNCRERTGSIAAAGLYREYWNVSYSLQKYYFAYSETWLKTDTKRSGTMTAAGSGTHQVCLYTTSPSELPNLPATLIGATCVKPKSPTEDAGGPPTSSASEG